MKAHRAKRSSPVTASERSAPPVSPTRSRAAAAAGRTSPTTSERGRLGSRKNASRSRSRAARSVMSRPERRTGTASLTTTATARALERVDDRRRARAAHPKRPRARTRARRASRRRRRPPARELSRARMLPATGATKLPRLARPMASASASDTSASCMSSRGRIPSFASTTTSRSSASPATSARRAMRTAAARPPPGCEDAASSSSTSSRRNTSASSAWSSAPTRCAIDSCRSSAVTSASHARASRAIASRSARGTPAGGASLVNAERPPRPARAPMPSSAQRARVARTCSTRVLPARDAREQVTELCRHLAYRARARPRVPRPLPVTFARALTASLPCERAAPRRPLLPPSPMSRAHARAERDAAQLGGAHRRSTEPRRPTPSAAGARPDADRATSPRRERAARR